MTKHVKIVEHLQSLQRMLVQDALSNDEDNVPQVPSPLDLIALQFEELESSEPGTGDNLVQSRARDTNNG